MISWGMNWICAKTIANTLPAALIVFWRFLFVSALFLPLLILFKIPLKPNKGEWPKMVVISLVMGVYQWLFFEGLKTGLAAEGALIVTTLNPIATFIFTSVLTRKLLKKGEWLGLSLGLSSVLFFLEIWAFDYSLFISKGTVLFMAAASCWALMTVIASRTKTNGLTLTFHMYLWVTPVVLIGHVDKLNLITTLPVNFWVNLGYTVVFGTIFSTSAYVWGAQKLGAKKGSSFAFIVPTSAALFAVLFLGETISIPMIMGGLLSLSGVYILNKSKTKH